MVIVDTSFKRLNSLLKEKLSVEELEEVLADMGMELDEVAGDQVKVEITAERTDLITPEGLARAINAYKWSDLGEEIEVKQADYIHNIDDSVKKYRPHTRSFVVRNLKLTDEKIKSLMWIQEKIHDTYGRKRRKVSIGVYDFNKIVFPVTYCARKPPEIKFVPLGMTAMLNGRQILQDHPTGKEYAHLLEGFDKYPLQIDSNGKILSLPPIINSGDLGKVDVATTDLFVESTGSSEEALENVMNILAVMFFDWGGEIHSVTILGEDKKVVCPNFNPTERKVSVNFINKWIGLDLSPTECKTLLTGMGYLVDGYKDKLTVCIPATRTDIWHPVDIADDVARAYGYNNITPVVPQISTIGTMLPLNKLVEDLCNFLTTLGLVEVKTFALTNHKDQYAKMNIEEEPHIALGKNTQDKELSMVRSWLLPEGMKTLVANRNQEFPQEIFEVGTIVLPDSHADVKARNVTKLMCLLSDEKVDFTRARQVLDAVLSFLGVEYQIKELDHPSFISGRVGEVLVKGKMIGILGELSPEVLTNWNLQIPVVGFEVSLDGPSESAITGGVGFPPVI